MKLCFSTSVDGVGSIEADLLSVSGGYFQGNQTFTFKGPFPVDPSSFLFPPLPEPLPGEEFFVYERQPPKNAIEFENGAYFYLCALYETTPECFRLSPLMVGNMEALKRLTFKDNP